MPAAAAYWDSYLVDSNILLRMPQQGDLENALVDHALRTLRKSGAVLFLTHQNIAEFWNVATRPTDKNGFGLAAEEAEREVRTFERRMVLLPDGPLVFAAWRELVATHSVSGKQVHDARLVA